MNDFPFPQPLAQCIMEHIQKYAQSRIADEMKKKVQEEKKKEQGKEWNECAWNQDIIDGKTIFLWIPEIVAFEVGADEHTTLAVLKLLVEWGNLKQHTEHTKCYYIPVEKVGFLE